MLIGTKSLARALYSRCRLVLLDDSFSGLDSHTVELIAGRLLGPQGLFVRNQTTVVIATHSRKRHALKVDESK